jgi:hypothetical protein
MVDFRYTVSKKGDIKTYSSQFIIRSKNKKELNNNDDLRKHIFIHLMNKRVRPVIDIVVEKIELIK